MAHRSNQAVASQELPSPQTPEELPPPPRRWLIGWTTALAALAVSLAAVAAGLWFLRFPIAAFFLSGALADRGADADFRFVTLDFSHAVLRDVRFGAETSPDAAVSQVEARWSWRGLSPHLDSLKLIEPRVRLRVDRAGRMSAGSLDRLGGGGGRARPSIPAIDVDIERGLIAVDAPFGALEAPFHATGTLGRDFYGVARLSDTTRARGAHLLNHGVAELIVLSRGNNVAFRLNADAQRLVWDNVA